MLLDAVPALARVARYGDVRQTNSAAVITVLDGIVSRACAGLPGASSQLDDQSAGLLRGRIRSMNTALGTVDNAEQRRQWIESLRRIHYVSSIAGSIHGLVAGTATRILNDTGELSSESVANSLSQVLSHGGDPAVGVQWIEGFFGGGGLVLVHDEQLLGLVDDWVATVNAETFDDLLPLLRRTFGTFAVGERRMIAEAVRDRSTGVSALTQTGEFDLARGVGVLPTILALLGVQR
jgi:Family of unknown function (DUF5682)